MNRWLAADRTPQAQAQALAADGQRHGGPAMLLTRVVNLTSMYAGERLPGLDSPEMSAVVAAVPLETLESSEAVIYATDPQLRLIYANPAWDRFAVTNGAPELVRARLIRRPLVEVIRGPLHDFYVHRFAEALRTARPVEHAFECPSAQLTRTFQMRILPVRNQGLLIINSLKTEEPAPAGVTRPGCEDYLDSNGLISMCSHCRRTQRTDNGAWEWVSAFVQNQPDEVSHGLCPVCLEYHYLSGKRLPEGSAAVPARSGAE